MANTLSMNANRFTTVAAGTRTESVSSSVSCSSPRMIVGMWRPNKLLRLPNLTHHVLTALGEVPLHKIPLWTLTSSMAV
jgi:hypothetical protein